MGEASCWGAGRPAIWSVQTRGVSLWCEGAQEPPMLQGTSAVPKTTGRTLNMDKRRHMEDLRNPDGECQRPLPPLNQGHVCHHAAGGFLFARVVLGVQGRIPTTSRSMRIARGQASKQTSEFAAPERLRSQLWRRRRSCRRNDPPDRRGPPRSASSPESAPGKRLAVRARRLRAHPCPAERQTVGLPHVRPALIRPPTAQPLRLHPWTLRVTTTNHRRCNASSANARRATTRSTPNRN